jgi:transcriptional regulator with XRE-family HTH domain
VTSGSTGSPAADHSSQNLEAIGPAIRKLRKERGLNLRDLSRRSGLSTGFLSLVERGLSSPALTSLQAIAKALETNMATFFKTDEAPQTSGPIPHVARASDDGHIAIAASHRAYKLLSRRAPSLILEPLLVTIQPGGEMEEPFSHGGEEFCYVLVGRLRYVINGIEYRLEPGDSIHFQSSVPHGIHNDGDSPVTAVWVVTPRLFSP